MFKNYWKVAMRYLGKHKGYTFINVMGLGVGIACCILIAQFVKSEWSFDRFHPDNKQLYRAWLEEHYQGELFRSIVTPIPLAPVLAAGLPEAEATCRTAELRPPVRINNNTFNDPVLMVDSNFFKVFNFPFLAGNSQNPFPTTNTILLTPTAAEKYFGKENAVGKNLDLQLGDNRILFTVGGLLKEPPLASSIQFGMMIPFANAPNIWSEKTRTSAWSNVTVNTFVKLKENADPETVNAKIATIMNPLVAKNYKPGEYLVRLQPLSDIHFNSTLPEDVAKPSDPKYAYILATIGILILLIACVNFVTLSIGRSATRAMEVGVRKVFGAERQQLIRQFWGEALLLTVIAMLVGTGLALLFQKGFNELANRQLSLSFDGSTVLFFLLLMLVIALLAGIYPAFVLSGFKPIEVLKGKLKLGGNIGLFRKGLIVGQFVASIMMIIGTFSVGKQLTYLRSKDLGYKRDHTVLVETNLPRRQGNQLAERFKTALEKNPDIISTTVSLFSMADYGWMQMGYTDEKKVFRQFRLNAVDVDFVPSMGLQVIAGRAFEKGNTADSNYILVNESLVKEYGWTDPIGQKLPGKYEERVLGVVKDFHIETLRSPILPAVLTLKPDSIFARSSDVSYDYSPQPRISVRFRGGNLQDHVTALRTAWKTIAGDQDFDYEFLDDALNAAYRQEQRLADIVRYASFLAIFVACMGLFGLATLVVVRRTKEIGIRKVLGADVRRIVFLLSKDFVLLVVVASLIAFPLAWWGLNNWLQDFAYRIDVPWMAFLGAAALSLFVALATVSLQAIKAALTNPVKSLRTE
jgi:putative ABC transport system permease protein